MFFKSNNGSNAVPENQRYNNESIIRKNKIDQSISSAELLQARLHNISRDTACVIVSALQNLSAPFRDYAKMPIPINKSKPGEFVGFLTGYIQYDL